MSNNNVILVSGSSATGKSACLANIPEPEGVMYLNTEANKSLPFPAKFQQYNVTDPNQIPEAFAHAETQPEIHTIVVDSLTFLLEQYITLYIVDATDKMNGWSNFQQYFKRLMKTHVANSTKRVIFTAHTETILNEADMAMETKVPVSGGLKKNGIEAYFGIVISTKRMTVKALNGFASDLLTISEDDEIDGFKYCFQTRLTKETVNERIRAPMGMFSRKETYTDNNIQLILNHVTNYYK